MKPQDSQRLRHVAEHIFCDDLILRFAQNQPDGRLVSFVAEEIIDGREVEVGRLEWPHLQIDNDEAAETQVVEQKIDFEIFAANLDGVLAADKGEADCEFEEKLSEMFEEACLQILFAGFGGERQEIKFKLSPDCEVKMGHPLRKVNRTAIPPPVEDCPRNSLQS
jgi:hypothetical protein